MCRNGNYCKCHFFFFFLMEDVILGDVKIWIRILTAGNFFKAFFRYKNKLT